MNTSNLSLRGLSKTLFAAGAAAVILGSLAASPAFADDWHRHEWREHEWREHEWREHHQPRVFVAPGYYAPPGVVYAAPPPVVYAPPPAVVYAPPPGVNIVVPLRIR